MRQLFFVAISAAVALTALAVAAVTGYHVTTAIKVGGDGGWDYLTADPVNHRLYVSHSTKVDVIDLKTNQLIGSIPGTPGVHGIAIAPDLNRGFISAGRGKFAVVFDLSTMKPVTQVATGSNPDAIQYDPASQRVFTFNGRSSDITVFDAKTYKILATIPAGGKPEFAQADGHGHMYFNIEDKSMLGVIDTNTLQVTKSYPLAPCEEPSGLAIDTKDSVLFSVCSNNIMAISDPTTGKLVATVPIGSGPDAAAYDPQSQLAFSSNGHDGTLTVVAKTDSKWTPAASITTRKGARTMALDPSTHRIYLSDAEFGPVPVGGGRPMVLPGSFQILVLEP